MQFAAGGLRFSVPPQWSVQVTPAEVDITTADLQTLLTTQDAELPSGDFVARILPRLTGVTLDEFASQFDDGWFQNYADRTVVTINGHAGVIFSDANATISHQPTLAAFIDEPEVNRVVLITMMRATSGESIEPVFSQVLSTIRF